MNTGIILAAGSSSRFKSKIPKQFSSFKDRMIIDYSVDTFLKHKSIDDIIIVVSKEYLSLIKDKYPDLNVIVGGKRRQESSLLGLQSCNSKTERVLLHDAARAMVSSSIITRCFSALNDFDGVAPALPLINTLAYVDNNIIKSIPTRKSHYELQTPQCFNYNVILNSFKSLEDDVTDDISVLVKMGIKCTTIKGEKINMKITSKEDLILLNQMHE